MTMTADLATSDAGLIYRVRRGAPRSPLMLMLHGLYGTENVMWLFDQALPRSATVISPRALFPAAAGFSWTRSVVHGEIEQTDFTAALEALQRFIPEMIERYDCDPQRVIVMGFSQGAAVSYALSLTQPDVMCGVVALAGFMPQDILQSMDALQQRYLIIHSTDDDIVPVALAREARSELEARGASIEYHEYPGSGHKVSAQGMKDIAQWIERILSQGSIHVSTRLRGEHMDSPNADHSPPRPTTNGYG
jgi:phospholipase/carboxylesterase